MAAFQFDKNKLIYDECKRVSEELFQQVRNGLEAPPSQFDAGIHMARKASKKLRALLRMLDHVAAPAAVKEQDAAIRRLAKKMSGARDSTVMLQTLAALENEFSPYIKLAATAKLEKNLQGSYQAGLRNQHEYTFYQAVIPQLDSIESGFREIISSTKGAGYDVLFEAIDRRYRHSRQGWKRVRKVHNSENFHKWRREVKHFWYLVRLIEGWNPGQMGPLAEHLNELGETLGIEHDLFVLQQYIRQQPEACGNYKQAELIYSLARIKQQMLREDALVTALSIFSRKPGQFKEWVRNVTAAV